MSSNAMTREIRDIRIVFLMISGLLSFAAYGSRYPAVSYALITIVALFLLLVAFSPLRLLRVFRVWQKIVFAIGKIHTAILLFIIFVFVLIPTGIVIRFFGFDPMQRKAKRPTLWEPFEFAGLKDKCRYEKQY